MYGLRCECGFLVEASVAGKKVQCPRCWRVIEVTVPKVDKPEGKPPQPSALEGTPPAKPSREAGRESPAPAKPSDGAEPAGRHCPACGSQVSVGALLCPMCRLPLNSDVSELGSNVFFGGFVRGLRTSSRSPRAARKSFLEKEATFSVAGALFLGFLVP